MKKVGRARESPNGGECVSERKIVVEVMKMQIVACTREENMRLRAAKKEGLFIEALKAT